MREVTNARLRTLWRLSLVLPLLLLAACDSGAASAKPPAPAATATARSSSSTSAEQPVAAGVYFIVGVQRFNQTLVALNPDDGSRRWSIPAPNASLLVPTDRVIYIQDHNGLEAVRASDGAHLWSRSASRTFTYANGVIYCLLRDTSGVTNALMALDGFTGVPRWTDALPVSPAATIWQAGNIVAVIDNVVTPDEPPTIVSASLYVVDANSGRLAWKVSQATTQIALPVLHGDTLYLPLTTPDANLGMLTTHVLAYSIVNGAQLWQSGVLQRFNNLIDADDARVYATTETSFVALHATNGARAWTDDSSQAPAQALLANGVLYAAHSLDAQVNSIQAIDLVAVDASTGAERRRQPLTFAHISGPPILINDTVYISSDGTDAPPFISAYSATSGKPRWRYELDGGRLVVRNGTLYAGVYNAPHAVIYALNASTGATLWKYTTNDQLWLGVIVAG